MTAYAATLRSILLKPMAATRGPNGSHDHGKLGGAESGARVRVGQPHASLAEEVLAQGRAGQLILQQPAATHLGQDAAEEPVVRAVGLRLDEEAVGPGLLHHRNGLVDDLFGRPRSEARRVGKECVRQWRYRGSTEN